MKMQHRGLLALTLAVACYGASTHAAPLPKPNVHYMRAADLGTVNARVTASTAGVVTKRANYGQGYVYGRSVNNQFGDIVIWDAASTNNYGKTPPEQIRHDDRTRARTAIGPKLTYKPAYGKTAANSHSQ